MDKSYYPVWVQIANVLDGLVVDVWRETQSTCPEYSVLDALADKQIRASIVDYAKNNPTHPREPRNVT